MSASVVYVCVCVCVCVSVSVCMCVCMYVCVCECVHFSDKTTQVLNLIYWAKFKKQIKTK